jgi:hypothetical protein
LNPAPRTNRLCAWAARALAVALLASQPSVARAAPLDAAAPSTVVLGDARAATAIEAGIDGAGRSAHALPTRPVELARVGLRARPWPPVVHPDGALSVVLSVAELVTLGPDGRERARLALGSSPAVAPPARLSDGTVVVVTAAPSVLLVDPARGVRAEYVLARDALPSREDAEGPMPGERFCCALTPLADGSFVVAFARRLLTIDARGRLRDERVLAAPIASRPLRLADAWLVPIEPSHVLRVPRVGPSEVFASFEEPIAHLAQARGDRVVARSATGRLFEFDARGGARRTLPTPWDAETVSLEGRPLVTHEGDIVAVLSSGELARWGVGSRRATRAPIDVGLAKPPRWQIGLAYGTAGEVDVVDASSVRLDVSGAHATAHALVDAEGNVLVARRSGQLVARAADGRVETLGGCAVPVGLVALAPHRAALLCRTGDVLFVGDAPASARR